MQQEYDVVIGGDPDRDTIDLAILDTVTGGVRAHLAQSADGTGYARIPAWARRPAPGRRIWALEGTGSFAGGLSDVLAQAGEDVTEVGSLKRARAARRTITSTRSAWHAVRLHANIRAVPEPARSRRPRSSPAKTPDEVEALIVRLRIDNPRWGARTLHTKLVQAGLENPPVVSTVHRVLKRHGLVNLQSLRKPQQWKRFERIAPNDLWQIDGTQVALGDGSKAWIVDLIDDHARYAIGATAVRRFTVQAAWSAMETAVTEHGAPRQLISDNGLQFTSRKGQKPVYFQDRLAALGVKQLS
ncbi:DDE-type integrase/transposase/recombinase, partial [Rhodococcus cerastii]|nr:DDE-type integrase/transposase/recombinase [Rhodococcus cerastii]